MASIYQIDTNYWYRVENKFFIKILDDGRNCKIYVPGTKVIVNIKFSKKFLTSLNYESTILGWRKYGS